MDKQFYEAFGVACHESMTVSFPEMSHSHPGHEWETNLYATGVHAGIRFAVEYQRLALRMKRRLWSEPDEFEGGIDRIDTIAAYLEPVLVGGKALEGGAFEEALVQVGERGETTRELVVPEFDDEGRLKWVPGVLEDLDVELDSRRGTDGGK